MAIGASRSASLAPAQNHVIPIRPAILRSLLVDNDELLDRPFPLGEHAGRWLLHRTAGLGFLRRVYDGAAQPNTGALRDRLAKSVAHCGRPYFVRDDVWGAASERSLKKQ